MLKRVVVLGALLSMAGVALRVLTPAFSSPHAFALPLVVVAAGVAAGAALMLAVRSRQRRLMLTGALSILGLAAAVGCWAWSARSGDTFADIGGAGIVVASYLLSLVMSLLTAWCAPSSRASVGSASSRP